MNHLLVDHASHVVSDGKCAVRVSPTEFLIFLMLRADYPGQVPSTRLEQNFYRARERDGGVTRQCLSVHLHNLEKKLERLNVLLTRTKKLPRSYGLNYNPALEEKAA